MTVPNHRAVPLLALWLDARPQDVVPATVRRPPRGTFVAPADPRVAADYVLDPRDVDRRIAAPPPGFRPVARNASWRVLARCDG